MADETTPLTSSDTLGFGPSRVFPNGVSPYPRRHNGLNGWQWCLGGTAFALIIAALVAALALSTDYVPDPVIDSLLIVLENETIPIPSNESVIERAEESLKILEAKTRPIEDEPELPWAFGSTPPPKALQEEAINAGIKALGDRELFEESLKSIPLNTPAFRHFSALSTNPLARQVARHGYVENQATKRLAELLNYTKTAGRHNIGHGPPIKVSNSTLELQCDFNARYRRPNGACNNKKFPQYGAALMPYRRMLNPDYSDGIRLPRQSYDANVPLPSARRVSLYIHHGSDQENPSRYVTAMVTVYGQFIDHEITANALTTAREGDSIDCCTLDLNKHMECFPVTIEEDPYYVQFNVTCMNFVRSASAMTGIFGPRQQMNQATAFIDGSVIYGSSEAKQRYLRTMVNGTLRTHKTKSGRQLLPLSQNLGDGCNLETMIKQGKYCFESGDNRLNENLLLTTMHMIWARHHNNLAQGLQAVNPDWDDETTFQEARKILGAQLQHITYNEFLPPLFGLDLARKMGLVPNSKMLEMPDTYDENVNPAIANSFAGAAYRFAHTLLPRLFNLTRENNTPEAVELHKILFNPFSLYDDQGVDDAIMAATNTPVQQVDRFFSTEMTEKLFQAINANQPPYHGLDVVSLNVQRGRDHGLPAYTVFREHCGLPPVNTWEEMATVIEPKALELIRKMYKVPQNIDLYTGAVSETPVKGAIFGPLLACLISDQFIRLKMGDSHYYERQVGPQRFTKDQLREIYNTTLSEIICSSSDSLQRIRKWVMVRKLDFTDTDVDCADLVYFNFSLWATGNQPSELHEAKVIEPVTLVRVMTGDSKTIN